MAASTQTVSFTVAGKTAIITGAGSGINFEFAKLLLERECNVVVGDLTLRPEALKLVEEYSSKDGGRPRAVFVKTNVTIWNDLAELFNTTDKEFGGADIVCPGAGVFEPHFSNFWRPPGNPESKDPIDGADGLGHYATLDINLTHPIRVTQLAISRWLNPPEGTKAGRASISNPKRVVHISSIAGQLASFVTPLYSASKHAISSFIRSMAMLDTIGIRVNGVAPGAIRTPLWTEHPEKMKMMDQNVDVLVDPQEVAEAMLRCCEDDEVGGGYVMEVLKGTTRRVDWRMDPGPQGPGATVANREAMVSEVFHWLSEPGWGSTK